MCLALDTDKYNTVVGVVFVKYFPKLFRSTREDAPTLREIEANYRLFRRSWSSAKLVLIWWF